MSDLPATATPVRIPPTLWDSDGTEEAFLTEWYATDGATVEAGAPLAEVMVDKVTMEVEAPASGRLEIRVPAESPIGLGTLVALIHPA